MWVRNRGKENELSMFFLIAWSLWGRPNKKLYEDANVNLTYAIEQALSLHSLFFICQVISSKGLHHISCWKSLEDGVLKLNVDGALFADV